MNIVFTKSKWEMWDDPLISFIDRCIKDGFDGTELYFDSVNNNPLEIKNIHIDNNLFLVGQILTEGKDIKKHLDSFKRQSEFALEAGSKFVNVHAGKDYFEFKDNIMLLKEIQSFGESVGVEFLIETHRGRATYSAIETKKIIDELTDLKLTADFSHWMVVHESDLSNQKENLDAAINRTFHIHARVGYEEGPQVPDPTAPEWKEHLANHIAIWKRLLKIREREGYKYFTITPEFGPPNYMHTLPYSNKPVRDTWDLNLKMKEILKKILNKSN